jgi:two-component system NtrC family sensor kinase
MAPIRISIRTKLTIGALLPLFIAILVSSLTGGYLINANIVRQAQDKVRIDLNSAREAYQNETGRIRDLVRLQADTPFLVAAVARMNREELAALLTAFRRDEQLDLLTAVDRKGRVICRARNPSAFGDDRSGDFLVAEALRGRIISGTEILPAKELTKEGNDLASQATITVVPTPHARAGAKQVERSGMIMVASAPVRNRAGEIVGALYGGILLNGNNSLVDRIKRIVYEGVKFRGEDVGTATIFLDGIRITTNVMTSEGKRAIGTILSEEVYNRVIVNREKWVDRAFVVKDWYFTAYEPILDLKGAVVGSLYVGMLEKPYQEMKKRVNLIFGGVLLLGSVIGLAASGFIGSRLAQPIKELQNHAKRLSTGERGVEITVTTGDEIGDLAREFNSMTGKLARREDEIRELNRDLEQKISDRTLELEEKNRLLVKAREELVQAEKLAAIGELAAGVAHEINNPMAIIRGNAEILQMAVPQEAPIREEVDIIAGQVSRVDRIVANLLKFARRERKQLALTDLNQMLDEIVRQVKHQAPLVGIAVNRQLDPDLPRIEADPHQLRQVFTNLILNAIQAMPDGGSLTLVTQADKEAGSCEVVVADTGVGIPQQNLEQIFNPFFTTRANGTGLGLSVSYGIVRDHGGKISVESEPGKGTVFRVTLSLVQQKSGCSEPGG